MKVLHICNDFSYSKVYKNLYQELDKLSIEQVIYHPLRKNSKKGNNEFDFRMKGSKIVYSSFSLKNYHRILFRLKVHSLFRDLIKQIDVSNIDISYPTTLYSDGAIAYKLFKKYKIPYIVAVRNTDVNLFLKYRPDLFSLACKILKNAQKVIFISKGLKELFFNYPRVAKHLGMIKSKIEIITNGIDDVWLDNIYTKKNNDNSFMYVGRFDTNKNIVTVISALSELRGKYDNITLDLVGGGGDKDDEVKKKILKHGDWIKYHGFIYDKNKLIDIFRKNTYFVMPSIHETFGLVYIEALTQGLPILYTKNQGVDGLFSSEVGVATAPNFNSVKQSLELMIESKSKFDLSSIDFTKYRWSNIACKYKHIMKKYS
ncbi:glycosyltransferase family 4 protein [Riemerella anatipestifer]|uniref:glycosyltransferase family 4 protein n=1 Tax=Riemerella anatipestifer TaxID=34085 RepID=UPI001372BDC8|nr:glycosyltransferase family 4 protein [Riemerella anatipestifer]MBT0549766.1 glycosyltransferase family 4 protein [Riemerella anatipestifer]MBT0556007.1 glycosyltransferase family 4 protein [Riemerella anatipestifer]MBT0560529.1 glycosyltransferase family 4 protein [Riemerella anatipestifer]NAV16448.1 glycosyltransferase [Riemerella anatipestifer]UZX28341.1 glycosyltransferase family 4 protein [Riemerella anatipestifer]